MSERSVYQKITEDTNRYYGGEKNPLRFAPVARDKEIAHGLALDVERSVDHITEGDLMVSALRAQRGAKFMPSHPDYGKSLDELKEDGITDRVRRIVVQTELTHARLAPEDFNQDQERSGAYEMGNGGTASHKL